MDSGHPYTTGTFIGYLAYATIWLNFSILYTTPTCTRPLRLYHILQIMFFMFFSRRTKLDVTYTDFKLFQCIRFEKLFQLLSIANALLSVFNCSCISKKKFIKHYHFCLFFVIMILGIHLYIDRIHFHIDWSDSLAGTSFTINVWNVNITVNGF